MTPTDNVQDVLRRVPLNDQRLQNILLASYRKRFPGKGVEFDELQPYHPGDDIRSIDWKSSVRTNSLLSLKYTESYDNQLLFIFDTSSSMNSVDSAGELKVKSAIALFSILSKIAFTNKDKVGIAYRSSDTYKRVPFTDNPAALTPILKQLDELISQSYFSEESWESLFDFLNTDVKDNTICFIIGDKFDFHLRNLSKLKLATIRHKLIFVEISNWLDCLDTDHLVDTTDIETGESFASIFDDSQLLADIKNEVHEQQTSGIKVTVKARYFQVSSLNHIVYDVIKLLNTQQNTFTKIFSP